jgi:hypothetical protein
MGGTSSILLMIIYDTVCSQQNGAKMDSAVNNDNFMEY